MEPKTTKKWLAGRGTVMQMIHRELRDTRAGKLEVTQ